MAMFFRGSSSRTLPRGSWVILAGALWFSPALAHAMCGDGQTEPHEECDDGNAQAGDGCYECRLECKAVADAATAHTCVHATHGPYDTVVAQKYPGFISVEPGAPHTYYTVSLPEGSDTERAAVRYWPLASGPFAIYSKGDFALEVVRISDGASIPLRFEHAVNSCQDPASLTKARVFELDENEDYYLVLGPTAEPTVALVIEHLAAFSATFFRDADGDGWGGDGPTMSSWCSPVGWTTRKGDCNDSVSSVRPDAVEICNGADDNCDAQIDEGLQCELDAGVATDGGLDAGAPNGAPDAAMPDNPRDAGAEGARPSDALRAGEESPAGEGCHVAGRPSTELAWFAVVWAMASWFRRRVRR